MVENNLLINVFDYFVAEWQQNSDGIILRFIVSSFLVVGLAVGVGIKDFFVPPLPIPLNAHPKLRALKLQNAKLQRTNHRLMANGKNLKAQNLRLEQSNKSVVNKNRHLLLKGSSLQSKNSDMKKLNTNLKNTNVKMEQRNRQLLFHKKNLKEHNTKLLGNNKDLKVRNRKLNTLKTTLETKNLQLEKNTKSLRGKNLKLNKSNQSFVSRHKKIEIKTKAHRAKFTERFMTRAKTKFATAPAKAVPFFGISVIVAMTAHEINSYCTDIEDMKKFEDEVFENNSSDKNSSKKEKLCGIDVEAELKPLMNKEYNDSLEWISKSSDSAMENIKKSYDDTKIYFYELVQ